MSDLAEQAKKRRLDAYWAMFSFLGPSVSVAVDAFVTASEALSWCRIEALEQRILDLERQLGTCSDANR